MSAEEERLLVSRLAWAIDMIERLNVGPLGEEEWGEDAVLFRQAEEAVEASKAKCYSPLKHWFLLSFVETGEHGARFISVQVGCPTPKLMREHIDEAQKPHPDAVLIAASYLGHMTREEVHGKNEE